MSYSQNENLILTASLVPIVLAAGTVFVGRRYFTNSQNDGSSNGVTRRRRFAKNSISRRPTPLLATTGVTPTSQRCDLIKKNSPIVIDDSMPGGTNRRITRNKPSPISSQVSAAIQALASDAHSNRYSPLNVSPMPGSGMNSFTGAVRAPKHIPLPNSPVDHNLLFELLMFMFTILAASLQFVHLYRSVWWLPHAYTNQSLNFYLIDTHLVIFIVTILSRRLIYTSCWMFLEKLIISDQMLQLAKFILKITIFAIVFSILCWCGFTVVYKQPLVNTFYLCYPISVYVILFGVNISPFFETVTPNGVSYLDGHPLHSCSLSASAIRAEVDVLRADFNLRMKQIIFNSVLNAYYVGFVPCCFAQSFLYYDVYWATQHLVFVWLGCFTMYTVHVVPIRYCDVLHRTALHLGAWVRVEDTHSAITGGAVLWSSELLYPINALVKHKREYFRALNTCNAAEPNNASYGRFFGLFYNPSFGLCTLLGLQILLVVVQLTFLVRSSHWYHIVSLALLLFVNYYTLFKLTRDYYISWKTYRNFKQITI